MSGSTNNNSEQYMNGNAWTPSATGRNLVNNATDIKHLSNVF